MTLESERRASDVSDQSEKRGTSRMIECENLGAREGAAGRERERL
jgi:hypothetical protein